MNFQNLQKIHTSDFYLDLAFRRASVKAKEMKLEKSKDRLLKAKRIEQVRLEVIKVVIYESMHEILEAFPKIDSMDEFYRELVNVTLDYGYLKKSLGAIKWAFERIGDMSAIYISRLQKLKDFPTIAKLRAEYLGRVSSIMKQVKKHLEYLDEARKTMKDFPAIKTSLFTVCLFGFPNAGKSTLLKRMTGANPEIKAYAFTTKSLNLGYIENPAGKIQVIDTPGTLNRQKMNNIELQAFLAVKHLAGAVVFVFDPTFERSLEDQEKLLKTLQKEHHKVLMYMSKTDIAAKENIKEITDGHKQVLSYDELMEEIHKLNAKALMEKHAAAREERQKALELQKQLP